MSCQWVEKNPSRIDAYGLQLYKEDVESVFSPATGIEVYHNYTLLHDDLMDRADKRRGKDTVHKVWNDNAAILSGDAMLVLAYQLWRNVRWGI